MGNDMRPRCKLCNAHHYTHEPHAWGQDEEVVSNAVSNAATKVSNATTKSNAERIRAWRERNKEQAKVSHREYIRGWRVKQKST